MSNLDLSLTIKAVDKATAPLRAVAAQIKKLGKVSGLTGAASSFRDFAGALKNVGGEVFALGAKLAAIGAAGAFALFSIVHGAVEAGDKLAEMADRVGVGVDVYASLSYAARQADVDQEAFNSAMDQFNKRLGEAKAGGGSLLTFLEKVSPKLAEQVKHANGTEAALSLMTDAFKRLNDPAKRAALSAEAFGKGGLAMGNFLNQGGPAIQKAQREFMRLAGSQEAFARGASDLDNVLRDTETAFTGLRNAAVTALFPAITKISKAVTEFAVKNRDKLAAWATRAGDAISRWIDGGGIERLVDGLSKVADTVGKVVDVLGPVGVAVAGFAVLAAPMIASLGALFVSAVQLGAALAPLAVALAPFAAASIPFLAAAAGVAAAGLSIYQNWGDLSQIFRDFWKDLDEIFNGGWKRILPVIEGLGNFALDLGTGGAVGLIENRGRLGRSDSLEVAAANALRGSKRSETSVKVDFTNLPRGARVSTDPSSTAPVSLDVGYSMGP